MTRYFEEHRKRSVKSLNGAWLFRIDPENVGETEGWQIMLPTDDTVIVPSMWNNENGLLEYEGIAWYQKKFYTEGGCLRFCFGGVMTIADVWLDGKYLGNHYGGFCQFDFITRDVEPGAHILTVRVDNRFDEQSIPQKLVDWYHYGGITRDITVETLKGICVLHNCMHYELNSTGEVAACKFELELYNAEGKECTSRLYVNLDNQNVYEGNVTMQAGECQHIFTPEFEVKKVRLWDMDNPYLYSVSIQTDTDDLMDRIGFRTICVENGAVKLNGKVIELRGVNRHEEHPDWGFAFPEKLMKKDLDIIHDLGCNTIRGSHYPNSRVFLDMLDERGILFWSEIPIWGVGFSEESLGDPVIVERGLNMHKEMVKYYYNHPSIVLWGMHNEIKSYTPQAYEMSKLYYNFLKEKGGNRLVTFASSMPLRDICMEFCDIICINLYYGWYEGTMEKWPKFLEEFRTRRRELGLEHKPVVFSEFGAAALYGHHTFDNVLWTEEYQANLLSYCLKLFHADPMVVGFYIWQFCDMRTCLEAGINRARGFNNKGILNEYRKPKAAYFAIRALYEKFSKEQEW